MVALSQHVLERALFLAVHREQLLPDLRVRSVLIDVLLALGDRVVEQHQLFLVAHEDGGPRLVELRSGELLQFVDGVDVRFLRALHVVERGGARIAWSYALSCVVRTRTAHQTLPLMPIIRMMAAAMRIQPYDGRSER